MRSRIIKRLTSKQNVISDCVYALSTTKKNQKIYYEREMRDIAAEIVWLREAIIYEPHAAKKIATLISKVAARHPEDKYVQELFKKIQAENEQGF